MASSPAESNLHSNNNITQFIQSTSSNFFSLFTTVNNDNNNKTSTTTTTPFCRTSTSSSICVPLLFHDSPPPIPSPSASPTTPSSPSSSQNDPLSLNSQIKSLSPNSRSAFPSSMKISGLRSNPKEGGPAFVGQVFSMCDISGRGLMEVSRHIDIPFISKRTTEWIRNMFSIFNKNGDNGPVFRFFMDLGDAVSYVKGLDVPTGVVGACRLDLAYEHFKEKPHMFQFVPNEKQVKAANKILKEIPHGGGRRKVDGVPVFTAQNLDIAIATNDGIKWYTPYFFDKNMLDNILEESVDQHFHSLIQIRHMERRKDVIDDNMPTEVVEENGDNLWEPPEVQEVLDEMGYPGLPLSVISKAAEMQLLYAVDNVLLGNRWLRKATGIQPKFPYRVDSFQKRSAASLLKAKKEVDCESNEDKSSEAPPSKSNNFRLPFGDWFSKLWPNQHNIRPEANTREEWITEMPMSPLLPKITMVGISTGEASSTGKMSKANLKKTMEDLTKEIEQPGQDSSSSSDQLRHEDRDPLFVANVGT